MSNSETSWAVIGGGVLGMTLALRLRRDGHEVTLIEGAKELGGLASTWQIGDVHWDRHYHVTLFSDLHLRSLLDELDLTHKIRWAETKTGVLAGGRLYSVSNAWEFLRFPELRMVDKIRLAWTILYASRISSWRRLEEITVEDWLTNLSGRRTFDRFWRPLLRAKLGENYHRTSAAFIWATIQRLFAARKNGLKEEMFGYVEGGYATILDRFSTVLDDMGVKIQTDARVRDVAAGPNGVLVATDGGTRTFDRAVLTVAAPLAAQMISGLDPQISRRLEEVEYQGIVCPSVLTSRPLGPFYVTNITDEAPFTGIIDMTALVDRNEFGGMGLVYLPKYVTADDSVIQMSDSQLEEHFLASLRGMHPGLEDNNVLAFRVSRVRYVMPLPTLRYSERVPSFSTNVAGVYTVNSAQILNGTLNVNETLQLAARAFPVLVGTRVDSRDALEVEVEPLLAGTTVR